MSYDFEESSGQRITYATVHSDYTSTVTISVWIKPESLPGAHQMHFVDKGINSSSGDRNFSVAWTPASGGQWFISFSDSSNNYSEWTASGNPTLGVWTHLYVEIDWTTNPDTFLLWVNGSSTSLSCSFGLNNRTPSTDATQHITIGGEHGSASNVNNMDGLIAEVAIWSDVVGSSRASGMYNSGSGGKADALYPTNLVEYIDLDGDADNSKGGSGSVTGATLSTAHPFGNKKIVKNVELQGGAMSSTSTTYTSSSNRAPFLYTAGNYDGFVYCYLEVVMRTNNASYAATCGLADTSNNLITDSVITTTSTSYVRLRSNLFQLTDATAYIPRIKIANASATCQVQQSRLFILQDGISAKTETEIKIAGGSPTTTSTTPIDATTGNEWTYTSANWGGTVAFYFEAVFLTDNASGTATIGLYDSANNLVTSSEVTTTSTTAGQRIRSSAITLVDGTAYKARIKSSNASYTTTLRLARVIIVQTVSALTTETYLDLTQGTESNSSTTRVLSVLPVYYDAQEWLGVTVTPIFETWMKSNNASYTTTGDLWNGSSAVADATTTSTANVRVQDTSVTLADNTEYDLGTKTSNASGTATIVRAYLIYRIVSSTSSSIKTVNGLAIASVKTVNGLAIASVKTVMGLA